MRNKVNCGVVSQVRRFVLDLANGPIDDDALVYLWPSDSSKRNQLWRKIGGGMSDQDDFHLEGTTLHEHAIVKTNKLLRATDLDLDSCIAINEFGPKDEITLKNIDHPENSIHFVRCLNRSERGICSSGLRLGGSTFCTRDDFIRRTEDEHIVFQHPNSSDGKPAWLKTATIVAKAAGKVIKAYGSKDPVGDAADQANLDYLEDVAKVGITLGAEAWLEGTYYHNEHLMRPGT
ncbi:MAG: hypothetical protein Q9191_007394 [Dirinaria sp. TL-2023a]